MSTDSQRLSHQAEDVGLSTSKLDSLFAFVQSLTESGAIPGACVLVARNGYAAPVRAFGRLRPGESDESIHPDTIFLVASITKPVTVTGAMLLVERGQLLLDDPVAKYIPAFGTHGKDRISIRHLMTHTSGLPDYVPANIELRKQHALLSTFVSHICDLTLDFEPGTDVQYQSTGLGILGAIVEEITGATLPVFLQQNLFSPLNMADTALGLKNLQPDRIAYVDVPDEMKGSDWGWNTKYWWNLGVPWGGMFTTADDLYRFMQMFLNHGSFGGQQILSPATVLAMTSSQLARIPTLPAHLQTSNAWGLGWALAGRRTGSGWTYFGDLVSPATFGHGGATGTLAWADPDRQLICILLTTQPAAMDQGILSRCSNLASAAAL